jgi:acyl-CoA thioesterase-1
VRLWVRARPLVFAAVVAGMLLGAFAQPVQAVTNGSMLAFGDSVPSGARCGCTPYPELYARKVAEHVGRTVRMRNDAVSGATSASVLRQVEQSSVRSQVRSAGTVLVMVGANDFVAAFRRVIRHRERAIRAYRPVARRVRANLISTIQVMQELRPGIRVVVAGYWNVVRDGNVGRRVYGRWGLRKAEQATAWANRAIRGAAAARHISFVSTYAAFKGAHGRRNPTWLLAADGDHPNARGHAAIAEQFFRAAPGG